MKWNLILSVALLATLLSCNNGPKVISANEQQSSVTSPSSTGIFSGSNGGQSNTNANAGFTTDVHNVKVIEKLPTEKYIYLKVEEAGNEFWIATRKQEVEIGNNYFYKGGLLKTHFESKEYNRVFDTIFLVSNIVPSNHSTGMTSNSSSQPAVSQASKEIKSTVNKSANNISIADLVKNKSEYEGKIVEVAGTCVKVNPNIMGRNWIHLKDGSMDDYDFVLTSNVAVPEGHQVAFRGKVALNLDFGAGYTYDLLIENAELIK